MRKLYEKNELLFALLWILIYCGVSIPIRGRFGDESIWMTVGLLAIACAAALFVKHNHLEAKYGLTGWPKDPKRFLYFIPMWIIVTGNLWGGISPVYKGPAQLFAILSMLLIGYIEELVFRGFLFKALIPRDGVPTAVIISSVTFGIGHIVNLLAGQASLETMLQVLFAISWGFIFTMVFHKSGSLIPCIIAHGLIDVFSKFAAASEAADRIYVIVTIVTAVFYCIYLSKLPNQTEAGR